MSAPKKKTRKKKTEPINEGHYGQLTHTVFIFGSNHDDFIMEHPVILGNPKLLKTAEKIQALYHDLYVMAGNLMFSNTKK